LNWLGEPPVGAELDGWSGAKADSASNDSEISHGLFDRVRGLFR